MTTYRIQFTQHRTDVLDPLGWMHVRADTMLEAAKTALRQALRHEDTDVLALVESGDFWGWVAHEGPLAGPSARNFKVTALPLGSKPHQHA
jgi:hypothetical protein